MTFTRDDIYESMAESISSPNTQRLPRREDDYSLDGFSVIQRRRIWPQGRTFIGKTHWEMGDYDCLDWALAMVNKFPILWVVVWHDDNRLLIRCRDNEDLMRPAIFSKRENAHKFAIRISSEIPDEAISVCKLTASALESADDGLALVSDWTWRSKRFRRSAPPVSPPEKEIV